MWRRDDATYKVEFVAAASSRSVYLVEWGISIAITLRIVSSIFSLVGSGRHSIMTAKNGSQPVGGCRAYERGIEEVHCTRAR